MEQLLIMQQDGLITMDGEWLRVTLKGRLLIRNICMVFDIYLSRKPEAEAEPRRY